MARQKPRTSRESDSAEAVKPMIVLVLLGTILYGGYTVIQKGGEKTADAGLGPAPQAAEAPPFQPTVELAAAPPAAAVAAAVPSPTQATAAAVPLQPPAVSAPQAGPTYLSGREGPPPTAGQAVPVQNPTGFPAAPADAISQADREPDPLNEMPAAFPGMDGSTGPASAAQATAGAELAGGSMTMAFTADWDEAHDQLSAGRYAEALALLSAWHDNASLGVAESQRLEDLLGQLAGTVIYSQRDLLLPPHVVAPGETLESVAAPLGVSWQLLGKINGVSDPDSLIPGEPLKILRGPFDAEIGVSRRRLTIRLTGNYAGSFPLAIGQAVVARTGDSLAVSAIRRSGPPSTPAEVSGVQQASFESSEAAVELEGGLTILGTDDPAVLAQEPGPMQLLVSSGHLADLMDILTPGSRVTIRP